MKKLPSVILAAMLLIGALITLTFNCHRTDESVNDTIAYVNPGIVENICPAVEDGIKTNQRGNLIIENGDVKIYTDYALDGIEDDDVNAADNTALVRYVNDAPKDTMAIIGPYSSVFERGGRCCVTVGVDTLEVNIHNDWPKILNVRFHDILPGYETYRISKHYALNDSARTTDFQINLAMSSSTSSWIKQFISEKIAMDAAYSSPWDDQKVSITPCDLSKKSVEYMLGYYYMEFCKQYHDAHHPAPNDEGPVYGEWHSYQSYIYPVWQSKDKRFETWRFYSFGYGGGAHGAFEDYYLTFDTKEGRILNYKGFYSAPEFKKAISILENQLADHYNGTTAYTPDLGDAKNGGSYNEAKNSTSDNLSDDAKDSSSDNIFEGKYYPRPALTKEGIVFSYQPYEKGGNSDGVLHFTQPYRGNRELSSPD